MTEHLPNQPAPPAAAVIRSPSARRFHAVLLYFFGSLGGLLFGYDVGAIGAAILFIRREFALTPLMQGVIVSSILVGAVFGSVGAGTLADRFGRRNLLLVIAAVFLVGALGSALAGGPGTLVAFRLLLGLGVGGMSTTVSVYLSEMAPANHRGALSALNILMVTLGILCSALVGFALSGTQGWRWVVGAGVLPAAILLLGLLFQPETPRWLVRRGRIEQAREVLRRVRRGDVERELAEIRGGENEPRGATGYRSLLSASMRPTLLIAVGVAAFQPLVGVNVVVNYTPTTMQALGFGDSSAILASVGVGVVNVVFTLLAILFLDRLGRRPLLKLGSAGVTLSLLAIVGLQFLPSSAGVDTGLATLICLVCYIAFYAVSWGPSVYVILPELFPSELRASGVGLSFVVFWLGDLLITVGFPVLLARIGAGGVFAVLAVIGLAASVFVHLKLVETKGASLEALQARWHS